MTQLIEHIWIRKTSILKITILYIAFRWLLLSGILQFAIDVVWEHSRKKHVPGTETSLVYGLNMAYALGQIIVALMGIRALRAEWEFISQGSVIVLGLLAAIGWLVISRRFIKHRELNSP